jgi:hypothetical protein
MITGYGTGESLRPGAAFAPEGCGSGGVREACARSMCRGARPRGSRGQWTFVEWEADEDHAAGIADALAAALRPELGWYADFAVGDERIVVFAGSSFRIARGDGAGRPRPGCAATTVVGRGGRAEAVAYGRSVGTPEHQLDRGR